MRNKSGANRLGFALLLKFFEVEARFPEVPGEVPEAAVAYVAQQVKVPEAEWAAYDWAGRAIKRHSTEIREAFGFRECSVEDQAQLAEWLAAELCPVRLSRERLAEAVVARCRKQGLELSPLFWTHVNPYGRFELDMMSHLDIAQAVVSGPRTARDAEADSPLQGHSEPTGLRLPHIQ